MGEVNELLNRLGELDEAPLIWVNKKIFDMTEEIERLNKENERIRTELNGKESIIKEVREYIEKHLDNNFKTEFDYITTNPQELLEILDKENI